MKKRPYTNIALIIIFTILISCKTENKKAIEKTVEITDFSKLLQPVPLHSKVVEDGYYVWGGSVVKGKDGLYHMYYSRWLKEYGFDAWVTHSEIAHATSENAAGPFKFKEVALPIRGAEFWDGLTTHNPTIHRFNDKYYLYYMGTTGDGKVSTNGLNFMHRNNQRIGMAWADDPSGPWHRSESPIIDVSQDKQAYDALMVSNPSVSKMKDGKILMIYKAVAKHKKMPFGGPVTHLAAIADSPEGPFNKKTQLIFYKEGEAFPAEDPYIWYEKKDNRYYAIVKDMTGTFTNQGMSLALFTSMNGLDWKPAKNALVTKREIEWANGELEKVGRLERPQLLIENNQPAMLYCAVQVNGNTFNVHIPLKK
ncbi:glycoside hydrolase family protein [Maribacter ulvicola]|uniref:Glycosyl hydrolases family 43 n=1 Tax=Maribacter ulvicola TaxID=228959 RepID=A0A1N6S5F4_9FLAO|nr:glycoside hydrolase family protein [Maribacter ulvicola]SIQ36348.1 hypothetical protein SAMN05421797_1011525 [Maribacter ulvicola]